MTYEGEAQEMRREDQRVYLFGRPVVLHPGRQMKTHHFISLFISLCAVVLLWAAPAGADSFDALLSSTTREGLPTTALRSKIKEGRAKRIPEPRIRMVVKQMVGHMRSARTWLRKGTKRPVPPRLLVSVAQARMAGLPVADLRTLTAPRSRLQAHRRVDSLVDMHLRGYRGKPVVTLVRRVNLKELPVLGKTVDALRKKSGMSHVQVTTTLLKVMKPGRGSVIRAVGRFPAGGPPPKRGPGSRHGPGPHPQPKGPPPKR